MSSDPYRSTDPKVVKEATARTKLRLAQQDREHRRELWFDFWSKSDWIKLMLMLPWLAAVLVGVYAGYQYVNFRVDTAKPHTAEKK